MVEFLVISYSPRCNLELFPAGIGSVWVCLDTGSPVGVDYKFGSEAADEGNSERQQLRIQGRSASAERHGRINSWTRKDQGVDLHRQRI